MCLGRAPTAPRERPSSDQRGAGGVTKMLQTAAPLHALPTAAELAAWPEALSLVEGHPLQTLIALHACMQV
jgi:hypothetical protein